MTLVREPPPPTTTPGLGPICIGCSREISPLPGDDNVGILAFGGDVYDASGGTLYQGVVCTTCHRTWCSECWVPMLVADDDVCPACGISLIPLTEALLRSPRP